MTVGRAFRRLTRVVRRLEESGWEVNAVQVDETFANDDVVLGGTVDCQHPDGDRSPPGTRSLELVEHPVQIDPRTVDRSPGTLRVSVGVQVMTETQTDATADDGTAVAREPLHQDRDRLASLYREHATFDDMAEAIPEDVSAETVRRYMIEHGIHEPGQSSIRSETADAPPEIIADGLGIPVRTEWEELIDAVARASTVYDVQRRLDLERDRTRSILQRLDLMDLVLGRLDDVDGREEREREIRRRLSPYLGGHDPAR